VYVTNLIFNSESSVFALNTLFHTLIGMFLPSIILVLRIFPSTEVVGYVVGHIVSLIPSFSCVWGIYAVAKYCGWTFE
jgi:hypothetical protein